MPMFTATSESMTRRGSGRIISATIATSKPASTMSEERDSSPPGCSPASCR